MQSRAGHAAAHHQLDGRRRQRLQQLLDDRQKPGIHRLCIVLHLAPESPDETLLRRAIAGRMVGDHRQVRVPPARPQISAHSVFRCFSRCLPERSGKNCIMARFTAP